MRKLTVLLLLVFPVLVAAQQQPSSSPTSLALTHVTVIDATGAPAKPNMTVVITGERITAIDKFRKVRIPKQAQVVDATGKFLIPGLWDMHVHALAKDRVDSFLPLFIANGVTGVRDMYGDLEVLAQVRKQVAAGALIAPRIVASGPIVDGPKPVWPGSIAVATAAEGRKAVDDLHARGVDFVKVYSRLPREGYFAISEEAKKLGLPFAGHVPLSVTAAEASDAGQKSIEHLTGVFLASSTQEEQIRKEIAQAALQPSAGRAPVSIEAQAVDSYSAEKGAALFARFVKNHTWQCPTLTVLRAPAYMDDTRLTDDPRLKYLPSSDTQRWQPRGAPEAPAARAEYFAKRKQVFQKQLDLVKAMHEASVEFLAGTDTPNPYCLPGFGLHDELALMVQAGFTPMEALQAATRNPAKYLELSDTLGTVEKGKTADLVLLDANPLTDIGNTQKIHAVLVGGKLIAKSELESMLAKVEGATNRE